MILFILQATGLGPVHGYIMGMIMSYLVFGITCKKKGRRIILALGLGCGMLGTFSALDWRFETALVLICAIAAAVVSPSIGSRKRDRLLGRIVEVGMGLHHKYR
jgi:hypothetical protein